MQILTPRRRRFARSVRAISAVAGVASLAMISGCDPCSSMGGCEVAPRVSYTGQVIERSTGNAVAGAVLQFVRTSGAPLERDTIVATSDADGYFLLEGEALDTGTVVGALTVGRGQSAAPYTVEQLALRTTSRAGDGGQLGRIVIDPYVVFVGEVVFRQTGRKIIGAQLRFRRTGGVMASPTDTVVRTDADGRFFIPFRAESFGVIEGEFVVPANVIGREVVVPVRIATNFQEAVPTTTVLGLGANLPYVGEVYRRGNFARTAGLVAEFRRTGGIQVTPSVYRATTTDYGLFAIQPTPQGAGEVVGDLSIAVPGPESPLVIRGLRLRTVDDAELRLAGQWGYGAQLFGQVEFFYRATGRLVEQGTPAVFRHAGGASIDPLSHTATVNEFGRIAVQAAVLETGEVVGDIELRFPGSGGIDTATIRVTGMSDDVQRFYGRHPVGRWFPQVGRLVSAQGDAVIPGARVIFSRTSGIALASDEFVVEPNADGYFGIRPVPLADGEVIGNLLFDVPAPFRDTTITGVRLRTSTDDTLRLVDTWRLQPSP